MKLAYRVKDKEEKFQKIYFSTPGTLANDLKAMSYEVGVRTPEYDEYALLGYVPPDVLVLDGWQLNCFECEKEINSDSECYVTEGRKIFCSHVCHETNYENSEAIRQTEQRVSAFLSKKLPGVFDIYVYQDSEGVCAKFRFPGGKNYATWCSVKNSIRYYTEDANAMIDFFHKNGQSTAHPETKFICD